MAPPPPPPPPPPLCFPFGSKKKKRLADAPSFADMDDEDKRSSIGRLRRDGSYSPTATLTSRAEKLTFESDSENYSIVPPLYNEAREVKPVLKRSNTSKTLTNTRGVTNAGGGSKKWGYGWGVGKKEKEREREREMIQTHKGATPSLDLGTASSQHSSLPRYQPTYEHEASEHTSPQTTPRTRRSMSLSYTDAAPTNNHTRSNTMRSNITQSSDHTQRSKSSQGSRSTAKSNETIVARPPGVHPPSVRSPPPGARVVARPTLYPSDSSSTLVGSALERKMNDVDSYKGPPDTTERLRQLRELMQKDDLDYYVIPSEDAHGSEYVAINDRRREWISGFTGSTGEAIVSKSAAYLVTDSRYWLQARSQLDKNWMLVAAGDVDGPKDWIAWLIDRAKDAKIGIDARMLAHEKATSLNTQLAAKNSKLFYPPQNLVDLIWKDKPSRPKELIYVQPVRFTGMAAGSKLGMLRDWIKTRPASVPAYSKRDAKDTEKQTATLVSSLPCIAWLLNLRGDDIPFNPVFHSYLFVSFTNAILFIEPAKVTPEIDQYLKSIGVERREYNDIWTYLRRKEWGEGKVIITPQTSYAISLMLTSYRYTVLPSIIEEWKAVKNEVELEGLKHAYMRDGAAYVRWLAWLEHKMAQGYDITEYEAAWRLTEFRRMGNHYQGLAYENISATGKNAALPHYVPHKSDEIMIRRDAPYLNDSGGQYLDGTCDTTRTMHFGRPAVEICEAFTRVLQGHIAIDSAIFPEGTTGAQLDVLARRALWKDGMNYMHGTGHGVGSFLTVHEGPHGFSSDVPLVPGHVTTNEPGFYNANHWGIRIESALFVKRVTTKHEFNGNIWLGFERLTCVPIQTKMVKDSMLTKEERQWLKDHNKLCLEKLEPFLREDKRALKWLKREADRGIGIANSGPGGIAIDWN